MHIAFKTSLIATPVLVLIACGPTTITTTSSSTGGHASTTSTGSKTTSTSMTSSTGGKASSTTSNTTSSTGAGGGGPTAAEACAAQAHASCEERAKCSNNDYNDNLIYGSEMDCEMRTALNCVTALMAKDTAQTPQHIETCVAAYPGFSCSDFFDNNPPAACIPPPGGLANGAACGASAQCMSTYCAVGPFETCGTCQPLPAVGAPCYSQADCGRNLACAKPTGATSAVDPGVCAARVMMGGSCAAGTMPCASGLDCVTMTGTCQIQGGAVGAACDTTSATAPGCDNQAGFACVPTNGKKGAGTCQLITLVAAGQPCGDLPGGTGTAFMFTSVAECEGGGECIGPDGAKACVAPAADGTACDNDPTIGPPCLAPAKCVTTSGNVDAGTAGTCTIPDATKCM